MADYSALPMDRETMVAYDDPGAFALLSDSFDWLRDLVGAGLRGVADGVDTLSVEINKIFEQQTNFVQALEESDNWLMRLLGEILKVIQVASPIMDIGKQIAIWILEDVRDILRSLAMLIDTAEETAEQTQEAIYDLAISAAAIFIPYVGRAGKIIYRILPKFSKLKHFENLIHAIDTEKGLAMLRHISDGDVLKYLEKIEWRSYAGAIKDGLARIFGKIADFLPSSFRTKLDEVCKKIGGWVDNMLAKVKSWMDSAIAAIKKTIFESQTGTTVAKYLDKCPGVLLDWVADQINGNLAESCVDNYFMNFMEYDRLYPPVPDGRDISAYFAPSQGLDGVYELPAKGLYAFLPSTYNGIPNSFGFVLEEMDLEVENETIEKGLVKAAARAIKPFGTINAGFKPMKPAIKPQWVVMEAKFGYNSSKNQPLKTDNDWKNKLGATNSGRQMSKNWIDRRLKSALPSNSIPSKYDEIKNSAIGYARWLFGAQPAKPANNKRTRSKKGKIKGLCYFPPYELKGFDMDALRW